ncbi:MAG TPA: ATP-binding protein [Dehalococcoidia bacterium]
MTVASGLLSALGTHAAGGPRRWTVSAEEAQRLNDLLELAREGYLITDRSGTIRDGNHAAARLLGLDRRFLPGKPLSLYVEPARRARFRAEISWLTGSEPPHEWDLELQPRHGPRRPASLIAVSYGGEDGRVAGIHWLLHDRSGDRNEVERDRFIHAQAARAQAETARRRQEALAEIGEVLGSSLDYETTLARAARLAVPLLADWTAVYLLDRDGVLQRTALAHVDAAREAEIAALWERFAIYLARSRPLCAALESGKTQVLNRVSDPNPSATADGSEQLPYWRALRVRAILCVPLRARGRTLGAVAFASEDAGRRYGRAEIALAEEIAHRAAIAIENARLYGEAQRAVRQRDEFLAAVSHDLRSPLSTIKGSAQLIARRLAATAMQDTDAAFAVQLAQGIVGAAATITDMVDQLLDLARQDAGQPLALDLRETDLVALVRTAIEQRQILSPDHRFAAELPPEPLVGLWDATRLRRVLENLLGNAVKYSPTGGEITVVLSRDAGSREAILSVTDQGLGIPAADLPHVFERFHRGANVVAQIPGTGIGLAGTRQIVEQHGGTIALESVEGAGTTVTVRLPLTPVAAEPSALNPTPVPSPSPNPGGKGRSDPG